MGRRVGRQRALVLLPERRVGRAGAHTRPTPKGNVAVQTDGGVFIGELVRERGLGHRFCQVFCDSRAWDTSNSPRDFFDTVFIDGGHDEAVVRSDTAKALGVMRSGGVVMWHDFCVDAQVIRRCESVRGVHAAVAADLPVLRATLRDLFWIRPSWVLVGVTR